ncbi:MAG TPA: site-specific DNA-methyltransferase [Ignavibacteriales bacterium]|nr:site-specific DNA-methyltransferase [Ignavibacteriales bacterium]
MRSFPDNSIDAIITEPPYGLSFMGKKWDYDVPSVEIWQECLRVLKPGGHILSFFGTRTYHRGVVRIEDAGFEIRDMISWIYGSGFPKSLNIGKAIDELQGNEREVIDRRDVGHDITNNGYKDAKAERKIMDVTKGSTPWEGWGTALKPAVEPIVLARKPLEEKTIAENVLKYGTGGLNIDGCRIETEEVITNHSRSADSAISKGKYGDSKEQETCQTAGQQLGRFPANLLLDEEAGSILDEQTGTLKSGSNNVRRKESHFIEHKLGKPGEAQVSYGDKGGASRFFYCAKASKQDRAEGLEDIVNNHPTVKPTDLMQYLIKLIAPPGGIVLDPFAGSGSTGKAAVKMGFQFIGIEREPEYCKIAQARIENELNQYNLFRN